jgi:hypothetical protein
MSFLGQIHQAAAGRGLNYLVIGGFAVNAHGFSRATGDLGLAVPHGDRALFAKYGTVDLYEKVLRACPNPAS